MNLIRSKVNITILDEYNIKTCSLRWEILMWKRILLDKLRSWQSYNKILWIVLFYWKCQNLFVTFVKMNFVFWLISSKGTSSLTRKTSLLSLVNLIYIQNVLKISRRWFLPFSKMINFYLSARLNKPFCINLVNRHPQNNFFLEITYIIVISTEFPLK